VVDHACSPPVGEPDAPVALALVNLRSVLLDRLREAIGSWALRAAHASLFGSAARGDGDKDCDIDLFIVRPVAVSVEDPAWRAAGGAQPRCDPPDGQPRRDVRAR
jgi:hypothetical protein